jgi:acetolactate synthase-1/2/3 large subunit
LAPKGCTTFSLAERGQDGALALEQLAEAMGASLHGMTISLETPGAPTGVLNAHTVGISLARHLPSGAVVSDDAATASLPVFTQTKNARPHEWLSLTGGAIGQGLPLAVGAAVASPARKVVALSGDGSAMYTVQALWTLPREALNVTVVIFANHSYRILGIELARTGAGKPGPSASGLLNIDNPRIDWVDLASALGLPAVRCDTAEGFDTTFAAAMANPGPSLIEVQLA